MKRLVIALVALAITAYLSEHVSLAKPNCELVQCILENDLAE